MNIGHWIIVAFILFAAFIGVLVTVCIKQDISLVSKEYYQEEIAYQDQIERMENTARLKSKPSIKIVADHLQVRFENFESVDRGEIKLFCPSNSAMDRKYVLEPNPQGMQEFELGAIQRGAYRAKLLWTMEGKEYYQEETIYI